MIRHLGGTMCVLQLKGLLMAIYFGADHVVWAGQAGLVANKQLLERYIAAQCSDMSKRVPLSNRPHFGPELHHSPVLLCSLLDAGILPCTPWIG